MKAVILAAGRGIRLRPFTLKKPKVLIEISGKPFLHLLLENLNNAGIEDIAIVAGHKKEAISDFLEKSNINAVVIEQKEQKGTGDALYSAKSWIGKNNFIVVMGDNLYSHPDIKNMIRDDDFCYIAGTESKTPERFGVLMGNGFLEKIIEKPQAFTGNLINTGLYKFTPDIFRALEQIGKSKRGEYELTEAINILCDNKIVKILRLKDYWLDLGSIGDIGKITNFLKNMG